MSWRLLWYVLRTHIAPFLGGTLTIMLLFLIQYSMRFVPKFVEKGIEFTVIGQFLLLNMSWILVIAIPIGVFFSTLMAFGSLSQTSEITVMKASGMSLLQMMTPVIITGLGLWVFVFWYSDNVLPDANLRLAGLLGDIERKRPSLAIESGQFTQHLDGITILARRVDTTGIMHGVTIYDRTRPGRSTIMNADSGRLGFSSSYSRMLVQLYQGEIHQRSEQNLRDYRVISFDRHQITLPADRFAFVRSDVNEASRGEREMRIHDMQQVVQRSETATNESRERVGRAVTKLMRSTFGDGVAPVINDTVDMDVERIRSVGRAQSTLASIRQQIEGDAYRADAEHVQSRKFQVEIYKKYAIPAACIIFVFVGCPLGIVTRGGNFGISAMICLGFYVLYWSALIGGEKLADRGILEPGTAMWLGNILIALFGVFITMRVTYEVTPFKGLLLWLRSRQRVVTR
jgi:lipopolysaccharide export system permease protein